MASYERAIKFENEKPNGVIRLVESNGFCRGYNHSAYLFYQVIAQHKVTRKFAKNINREIVYIGFPADKLLEEWLLTVPKDVASRGDVNALVLGGTELYRAVCERIRLFPMETKSLIENVAFLGELKKALAEERRR